MRLDHLLSKEPTARRPSVSSSESAGELLRRSLAIRRHGQIRPRHPSRLRSETCRHHRDAARSALHCSVLRESQRRRPWPASIARPRPAASRCRHRRRPAQWPRGGIRCPHSVAFENCIASTSIIEIVVLIERECIPSYKEPTVDALAPDADEGRGWLRKATGSCLPSFDPWISEWGNPAGVMPSHPCLNT